MFIKVGGPNGSGKTTVTTQLEELGGSFGLSIERVKGGDILLALANVATYDELRRIPEEVRAGLRPEMYRIMYEMDRNDPGTIRVRDAHFTLFDECTSRFVEGELQNGDKDQMLMMIVLNPSREMLLQRRLIDINRVDRSLEPDHIELEISTELRFARRQARAINVKLLELPNPDGQLEATTLEIINEIRQQMVLKEGGAIRFFER